MLKGKIAVVTGGTRGIGYAIVKKYLENGAKVILFGSRQETVDKALASLKEENPEWEVSGACPSLTDAKEVADEIQAIHRKYGKIDILVNNAGGTNIGIQCLFRILVRCRGDCNNVYCL
jgi:NAD(P)-dependent dehydrogenase (short-subunit alcohol dehydrogenase family)